MIERFQGEDGRKTLIDALKDQKLVAGNADLAEEIAQSAELLEKAGTTIIEQGGEDNDLYLIIAGAFDLFLSGRFYRRRVADDHVGEMASNRRNAAQRL